MTLNTVRYNAAAAQAAQRSGAGHRVIGFRHYHSALRVPWRALSRGSQTSWQTNASVTAGECDIPLSPTTTPRR